MWGTTRRVPALIGGVEKKGPRPSAISKNKLTAMGACWPICGCEEVTVADCVAQGAVRRAGSVETRRVWPAASVCDCVLAAGPLLSTKVRLTVLLTPDILRMVIF